MRVLYAALFATSAVGQEENIDVLWSRFKRTYGRVYNGDDEMDSLVAFTNNVAFMTAENAKGLPYTVGIGPFADLTNDEFKQNYLGFIAPDVSDVPVLGSHTWQGEKLADSVDWTTAGAVTPIKDQGRCGSCWAFSSTGSLEGAAALASGQLKSFSEQQLVDCAGFPNMACKGGQMTHTLKWAESHDMCEETSYPYRGTHSLFSKCQSSSCSVGLASGSVTGVNALGSALGGAATDEDMMSAVSQQPLSVALEADKDAFQHYVSGVLTDATGCGAHPDHGVLVVGYGTDGGVDYWKVKNSWGTTYGENGFLRIARGNNVCAINSQPVYPIVSASVAV